MSIKLTTILGVNVSEITYKRVLQYVSSLFKRKQKSYICVAAVHLIMECQKNPTLLRGVNKADITTPDGMPLVWLSKLFGAKNIERVYGPTLMLKICSLAQASKWRIFILGGASGQAEELCSELKKHFPKIKVVGFRDTPGKQLSRQQNKLLVQKINRSGAHIVFIGMGCPYQELWMINNRKKLNANILIGVGAAFNFLTNREKQAPSFLQQMGLEWLFRLIQNPSRLWNRYIITNTLFIILLIRVHLFQIIHMDKIPRR